MKKGEIHHHYPKTRKPRDISYSESYKLFQAIGEETLRKIFHQHGMYIASIKLSEMLGYEITPFVVRHCRDKYIKGGHHEETAV